MTDLEKAEAIARIAIKNGKEKNLVLLTEECAELIQAVSKYKRTGNKYPVAEEMAEQTEDDIFQFFDRLMKRFTEVR